MKKIFSQLNIFNFFTIFAIATIILTTLVYCLPENARDASFNLEKNSRWIKLFLSIGWMTLFLIWLSWLNVWLRTAALAIILIPSIFFFYIAWTFKLPYSYMLLVDILETNPQEAFSFINISAIAGTLLTGTLIVGISILLGKLKIIIPAGNKTKLSLIFGVPAFSVLLKYTPLVAIMVLPSQILKIKNDAMVYYQNDRTILSELIKIDENINTKNVPTVSENAPIVFLHLGESVRADHAPMNGYSRNTFPRVFEKYKSGEVVSFPNCTSFSTSTRLSSIAILTPQSSSDQIIKFGTFIPYLNAAKIKTLGFFSSMPNGGGYYDSALLCITKTLQEKHFSPKTSDDLMPLVHKMLSEGSDTEKKFYFYYGEGAHVPATLYNYEKYNVFTPVPAKNEGYVEDERRINAYDNCCVATDDFCGNAIDALADKNAIYIYVADHGDMLGEDEYWARNSECALRPECRRVLFFIWCSEKFRKKHPQKWNALCGNAKNLPCVSHDYIYHTILGATGVRTPQYQPELDLFSENAKAFPLEIPKFFNGLKISNKELIWAGTPADKKFSEKRLEERQKRLNEKNK